MRTVNVLTMAAERVLISITTQSTISKGDWIEVMPSPNWQGGNEGQVLAFAEFGKGGQLMKIALRKRDGRRPNSSAKELGEHWLPITTYRRHF